MELLERSLLIGIDGYSVDERIDILPIVDICNNAVYQFIHNRITFDELIDILSDSGVDVDDYLDVAFSNLTNFNLISDE